METLEDDRSCEITPAAQAAWVGVSAAFAALGRIFLCLDRRFRVLHASTALEALIGPGGAALVVGRPAEDVLGVDLFGADGTLRQALLDGERREGWRSVLEMGGRSVPVSLTVAPFAQDSDGVCDPRVAYVVVLRAAHDDVVSGCAPTVFGGLVARSPQMAHLFRLIDDLRHSDATVLLTGESGTGKELVAHAIHAHSPRRSGPFVAVNCGALPGELLESALFGHVRGAFTGAVRDRVGHFEAAHGGTLFLDEIGDLPQHLQVKLLRVLQDRKFERVSETNRRTADARIIASTPVDLRRAVTEGHFRDDLFDRLRVVPIDIPPLRERREDIEPIAQHLLARVAGRHGRTLRFSREVLRLLLEYQWPGNVRELENALEFAVAVAKGQTLQPEDLPLEFRPVPPSSGQMLVGDALHSDPLAGRIVAALEAHRWRREPAARALGMSRATLWRRMRELGLAGTRES